MRSLIWMDVIDLPHPSGLGKISIALATFALAILTNIAFTSAQAAPQAEPQAAPAAAIDMPSLRKRMLESEAMPTEPELKFMAALLEVHPDDVDTRCLLGICYDKIGLPDLAQEQFKLAMIKGPSDPGIWISMIKRELLVGHALAAQHLVEVAHQRFPQNPEVLFWYGNFLAAHQQGDQAAYAYELALNQKQDVPGLRSALAEICVDKTRYGDAVRLAKEEIKRHPEVLLARKAMGLAYFGMRQKAEAVAPLTVAFEKLPPSSEVSNALAQSLIYCGKWDQALLPTLVFLHRTSLDQVVDPKAKAMAVKIVQKCSPPVVAGIPELARTVDWRAGSATFHFNLADVLDQAGQYDLYLQSMRPGCASTPISRAGCSGWAAISKSISTTTKMRCS